MEINTVVAILPGLSRHNNSDTSTLAGEDTVDETITVLAKRRSKTVYFTLEGGKTKRWG